jgi:predicted nucleic acid-binding Zn ribbon protein
MRREALEARKAETGERRCPVCGNVIPDTVTLRAICCSRECGVTHQNRKRAEAKRAKVLADRKPCPECGGPLPETHSAHWTYCSTACKKKVNGRTWRAKSPEYMRKYLYGMAEGDFQAMLERQGGGCAICGTSDWRGRHSAPHVDHCHTTGKVRGILCHKCNLMLGNADDDPARLQAAARYIIDNA